MAKQIQDMPLKTGVSGNEDILIQDNGVTKRIKASELMDESTTVDLSGYYTKTEVDDLLTDVSSGEVDLSDYAKKDELDVLKSSIEDIDANLGGYQIFSNNIIDFKDTLGKTVGEVWGTTGGWIRIADVRGKLEDNVSYFVTVNSEIQSQVNYRTVDANGTQVAKKSSGKLLSENMSSSAYFELYLSAANSVTYSNLVLSEICLSRDTKKDYDEFRDGYKKIYDIENDIIELKAGYNIKSFPTLLKIKTLTMGTITIVGDELLGVAVGKDDNSTYVGISFRDLETFNKTKSLLHNWGHANTIDYNGLNDSLILGNGGQDTTEDNGKIYIIQNFKERTNLLEEGAQMPLTDYAVIIDLAGYNYGYKANVIWGESNGERADICYLITSDMKYIRKLQLGKGINNLGLGQYNETTEDLFNGSFRVVQQWTNIYTEQIQDAQYYNGKIYAGFGHYGNTFNEIELLEDGGVKVTTRKELLYDATGEIITERYSAGLAIKDDKLYFTNNKSIGVYHI